MTVGTLIKRLSNYHGDYVVKSRHREGGKKFCSIRSLQDI